MEAVKIDNKKMWESIISKWESNEHGAWFELGDIYAALKDQGFTVNNKGEIVSIEPESQRMTSAKAKEALLPDGELSEFEKAVQQTISSYQFLPQDIDHCVRREDAFNFYQKAASSLLSIARKQFIEEACEWLDENLINYWSQAYTDNCDFIEDFRKALEKGV